jgi:hypothetical protein
MRIGRIYPRRLAFLAQRSVFHHSPFLRSIMAAAEPSGSQLPKKETEAEEATLPKLSPAEFKQYNRLADMMENYVLPALRTQ